MASTSGSEDPTENLKKEPSKGILKPSVSYEEKEKTKKAAHKSAKWDEMNILKTLHPADKDYGHMKVDEPKTPFEREIDDEDDEMDGGVNADDLRKRIEQTKQRRSSGSSTFQSEDDSDNETPESKLAKEIFEKKRKEHYNEFKAAKMAKQMMEEEDDDEDNNDENKQNDSSLV